MRHLRGREHLRSSHSSRSSAVEVRRDPPPSRSRQLGHLPRARDWSRPHRLSLLDLPREAPGLSGISRSLWPRLQRRDLQLQRAANNSHSGGFLLPYRQRHRGIAQRHDRLGGYQKHSPSSMGMFALAFLDPERREVTIGRDRLGIKPIFVTEKDGTVCSLGGPGLPPVARARAGSQNHRGIPLGSGGPTNGRTFLRNISYLMPGAIMTISSTRGIQQGTYSSIKEF